ncbi:MAG: hypothetical protein N2690_02485 [Rhodocyclaceae bacterium]|nr:hypothetical protein [Rhodocyclaceae bacterium]
MKLSDTQAMLLSKAAQHPQGLVPQPSTPPAPRAQIARKLREAGLIECVDLAPGEHPSFAWGRDTEGKAYAFRITAAGMRAIGVDPEDSTAADDAVQHHQPEPAEVVINIHALASSGHPIAKANAASWPDGLSRKRRAQIEAEAAADRGVLPEPPDFSAATHAPYRKRLEKLVEMAKAGDADGLRGVAINPTSTSPRALIRYRDLCIRAIEARAKKAT